VSGLVLTTERFELWQPQTGDLADIFELTKDEETRKFLGSFVPSVADSFARLHRNAGSWALWGYGTFMVRRKGEARIVANCGVFRSHRGFGAEQGLDNVPEAGWIVHHDLWGQGVASEMMRAALAWFDAEHGRQRVAAMIEDGHAASDAIARKLGFVPYGQHQPEDGAALVLYERLPS
jgi:RimJ/RimL family protein N-acetyltransferase